MTYDVTYELKTKNDSHTTTFSASDASHFTSDDSAGAFSTSATAMSYVACLPKLVGYICAKQIIRKVKNSVPNLPIVVMVVMFTNHKLTAAMLL